MRINVLTENHAGPFTKAEHGLSYLIEHDEKRILFDTGQSDTFIKNARKMGVSLDNLDAVILSHGHFDHGNGLEFITGNLLICHPSCFVSRYRKKDHSFIGLKQTRDEISAGFDLITSAEPYCISENIVFLGEIPRVSRFESKATSFVFDSGSPDYVIDDSAVALILPQGLFIVTGCGHAGVLNTIEHARKVTGINMVYGLMGGLHLKEYDHQTKETIRYLKDIDVKHIFPSHCTELPALSAFYMSFGNKQVKTGDIIDF